VVDFDIYDETKDKFLKFTDSYDAWMNRHEYEDQKLSDRHPFTVQRFSKEFSAILANQIVQKGTDSKILSLLQRFLPDVNWPVRIGKYNSCFSNMDAFKEPELPFLSALYFVLLSLDFLSCSHHVLIVTLRDSLIVPIK
jgi:hypothetical protein